MELIHLFSDYGEITKCKKHDLNLGWTSYDWKPLSSYKEGVADEDICKNTCNSNTGCDFYTYVGSIAWPLPNCWCGEYTTPKNTIPNNQMDSFDEVTLKFKKGESYYNNRSKVRVDIFAVYLLQMKILLERSQLNLKRGQIN